MTNGTIAAKPTFPHCRASHFQMTVGQREHQLMGASVTPDLTTITILLRRVLDAAMRIDLQSRHFPSMEGIARTGII